MIKQSFDDLMERYNDALAASGVSCSARLGKLYRSKAITRRHEAVGREQLDDALIAEYVLEISERLSAGEISQGYASIMNREIEQFVLFVKTGEVKLPNPLLGARMILPPEFQRIADEFLESDAALFGSGGRPISPNTRNDMRWVAHKYFEWLAGQGFKDLQKAGAEQIRKFLLYCSETMAMGSVHNTRIYLMKLYAYLYESGQSKSSFGALLSFKVNRGAKTPEALRQDELAALLEAIDRGTVEGKRAYAVMMLGIVLGLRAVDVVNLKLSDIDWMNGEVKILQAKTAVSVVLPLTKDVGEALKDYIINARPRSDSPQIFLRLNTPYTRLKSAVTAGEIYNACRKAAGLPESKRFHTLRRSLGTSMLAAGEPVTTVAQVLGHAEVDSTKKYIAVDTEHLKMCALTFDGIKPKGGARK
ncbi:MAG: tyrosine-type recombinase/integrase [Firmicutes bacterium]|nr:tyrosine-type recombinase/integrase [Bacillota bacterium]